MKRILIILLIITTVLSVFTGCNPNSSGGTKNKGDKDKINDPGLISLLEEVMPGGRPFKRIDLSSFNLSENIINAYISDNDGYVIEVKFDGFNPGNTAIIGVSANGKVTGTKIILNLESSGFGLDILPELDANGHFNGATLDTIEGIDTIAGCTNSTKAYRNAIKDALRTVAILKGEEINQPEPTLNDILNSVLGTKGLVFEQIDIGSYHLSSNIKEVYKSYSRNEYVFKVEFNGFNMGNVAYIGIDSKGEVAGTRIIVNNETYSYGGATILELDANGHFNGATFDTIEGIDTIAGCTISTKAYRTAIKDALAAAAIFGGGDVDLRDPEQILSDNLNAALGVSGVEFDKHFFMEVVEGVDAIYVAKDGSGHVVVIGEAFYGFDAFGNAIGQTSKVAVNALATIKATTLTELVLRDYDGVSNRVISARVTDAGVYVLEVEGAGFGKKGSSDYGASGEYIVIRIALTADGRIIDCYTVYQSETMNFGDVCGTEEFYGQFAGKNEENYEEIAIAGATYTTDGYHGAIKNAFKAVAIFEDN